MAWPYSFQNTRKDFFGTVPTAGASTCTAFIKALITLPFMIFQWYRYFIDENANLTATFLSMIYTPGEIKGTFIKMDQVQKGVWLPCDGSVYPQATYPDLYATIGTTFNTQINPNYVDSNNVPLPVPAVQAGYFRVPDMRGMTLIGAPAELANGSPVNIASTTGESQHTLVAGEDVPHQHVLANSDDMGAAGGNDGGGNAATAFSLAVGNFMTAGGGHGNVSEAYQLQGNTDLPTVGLTGVAGGEQSNANNAITFANYTNKYLANPHNNMQPSIGCYFYMFAGVPVVTNTTSTDPTLQPI